MGSKNRDIDNDSAVASQGASDYTALIDAMIAAQPKLMEAQEKYGPANIAQRLEQLRLSVGGSADTASPALYMEALRKADPQGMAGLDSLSQSANEDLKLGRNLNANQNRQVEQSVRGGQAARGMGYGPTDIYQEMLQKLGYGDQLLAQRQQQAMNVSQVRTALGSRGVDAALGMGTGVGPALISNDFAGNLLGSTYAQAGQQNIAEMNRRSSAQFGGMGSMNFYGSSPGTQVNYDPYAGSSQSNGDWLNETGSGGGGFTF